MNDDFEFNCRLFIHSDLSLSELRQVVSELLGGSIVRSGVETNVAHFDLMKWDGFDPLKINDHKGFLHYKYSAEVNSINEVYSHKPAVAPDEFCIQLCHLVKALRQQGHLVVVASEFEDFIVKETGWNWSEKTPTHP